MNDLNQDYSNIVINYDFPFINSSSNTNIAQMFVLPEDYVRGTNSSEKRIPDISGIQILVALPDNTLSCDWSIGYSLEANPTVLSQFTTVQSGATNNNYTPGSSGVIWYEIIFNEPIEVTEDLLDALWLIQFTIYGSYSIGCFPINVQGFDPRIQGYELKPIYSKANTNQYSLGTISELGVPGSFSFKLLSLIGDNGTDFLGNQYRSIVSTTPPSNVSTFNNSIGGIGGYWLSPALPASDAVASLYFDMRSQSTVSQYGLINLINDPSFEYDSNTTSETLYPELSLYLSDTLYPEGGSNTLSSNWTYSIPSGTLQTFEVITGDAPYGTNMLQMVATNIPSNNYAQITTNYIPIQSSTQYFGSAVIQINSSTACYGIIQFNWYTESNTYINSSYSSIEVTKTSSNFISSLTATSPIIPNVAAFVKVCITLYNTSGSLATLDFQIDGVCLEQVIAQSPSNILFPTSSLFPSPVLYSSNASDYLSPNYFDGDMPGYQWTGQPGNSSSIQVYENSILDEPIVVDALIFEPLFANQNYTLYYSNDDNGLSTTPVTTEDWESKLWTRAITVTTNLGNETQVLPTPIGAKYLKIELTNPQMQQYDPGNFQLPISYKAFPSWVQNYFLSQINYPSYNTDQVIVQSDALNTLYNPNITDLLEQPNIPTIPSSTTYTTTSVNSLDNTTLSQIDLSTAPYQDNLGSQGNPNSTLGSIANIQANNSVNGAQQVTEGQAPTYPSITTVSSLQRNSVLAELLAPNMYFFYTCRHAYMQKSATLTNNKAYFFGVNNITFLRSQGSVVSDSSVYTETGLDMSNSTLNDFTITSEGWWETYAAS